jgi:hypothetical protein
MTGMMIFNLIAAIAVVAGLVTVCRTAHVVAGRSAESRSLWKPRLSESSSARRDQRCSGGAANALERLGEHAERQRRDGARERRRHRCPLDVRRQRGEDDALGEGRRQRQALIERESSDQQGYELAALAACRQQGPK